MRLIKANVPEGYGRSVMETAFSVKIAKVTIHNAENHLPNGNVEPREIIDIEASTPKANPFAIRPRTFNADDINAMRRTISTDNDFLWRFGRPDLSSRKRAMTN